MTARARCQTRQAAADQAPQLAALAEEPPEGDGWISEIKFDGYRLLAWIDDGKVRLVTRNGHDWTDRLPAVAAAVGALNVDSGAAGRRTGRAATRTASPASPPAGRAVRRQRRDAVSSMCSTCCIWTAGTCARARCSTASACLPRHGRLARHAALQRPPRSATPPPCAAQACQMKLEGIICKQADAPYRAGRGHGWLKVKCLGREEFVVLGWTPPARQPHRPRRAASRLLRSRAAGCTMPAASAPAFPTTSCRRCASAWTRWRPTAARTAGRGRSAGTDDPLGAAGAGGRSAVHRLVRRRPGAPRGLSRPARGQGGRARWCATPPTRRRSAAP